ncbi:GNAT family N-acetyltransferase [Pseudalkalibacillus decolorationis]|uniref:GNAT family N-acetyltransferase n=1 Tax=Pseudalkalibacillus decolorationis TaxID=163879 RepID=UPI002147202F|nr:N-acetyltransferase [Pseudalkalibacillus decolorationis]
MSAEPNVILRTEKLKDHEDVYKLNSIAFENREDEPQLVERIRLSEEFIPELSIVAEENNEIVGHILLSEAKVINEQEEHKVIVLAPVAVKPSYQKQGIGTKLIEEGLKRCKDLGYGLILLIGHPTYYPRFGFKPARDYGLELKQFDVADEVFMVCEIIKGELDRVEGELIYPKTFFMN